MQRLLKNRSGITILHYLARVHDSEFLACLGDDAEIVADEDHREI